MSQIQGKLQLFIRVALREGPFHLIYWFPKEAVSLFNLDSFKLLVGKLAIVLPKWTVFMQ